MKQKTKQQWNCSLCHITTHGEWDAESRPMNSKNEDDWGPICQSCTADVKKDFIADTEDEDVGTYSS